MTEQQIKVGIKKCAECEQNLRCKECKYPLMINNLQAENENLVKKYEIAVAEREANVKGVTAEIKRLTEENKILSLNADTAFQDGLNEAQELYAEQIKCEIKSEAYKECIDEVSEIITGFYNKHIFGSNDLGAEEKDAIINFSDDITYALDNLLKEVAVTESEQ